MQEHCTDIKSAVRSKICIIRMTPNYPLGNFIDWAETQRLDTTLLMDLLDTIQTDLDADETMLRNSVNKNSSQLRLHLLHCYWCLYCSQIRAYYKAVLRDPHCKRSLSFLL